MSKFLQLEVNTGTAKTWILLKKTAKIADIFPAIAKNYAIDRRLSNILLYNQGRCLPFTHEESLSDYGLTHLSKLDLQVTLSGGIWPLKAIKERKVDLRPLPGFITVTTSSTEPDMISLEADPDEKRAKMPCGHVIGPMSMTSYCQSLLSQGEFKFVCPSVDSKTGKSNCDKQWEYFLVRHVACLSDEENQEFEKKISENYLKKLQGLQQCPNCTVWCFKDSKIGNYVRCSMCKKDFCWACLRDWMASSIILNCGNLDCDGRDNREKILAECKPTKINECAACPSIRACPNCLLLMEHKEKCGHMTCPSCKHGFCFICLKGKTSSGQWPCSFEGNCTLAPRQISDRLSSVATETKTSSSAPNNNNNTNNSSAFPSNDQSSGTVLPTTVPTIIQVFVDLGVKRPGILMRQDGTIDELFNKVCAAVDCGLTSKDIFLTFGGSSLAFGKNKKLSDYGIVGGSRIQFTVPIRGAHTWGERKQMLPQKPRGERNSPLSFGITLE